MNQDATAVLLTDDNFESSNAKTSHALVRGPSRYKITGVIDAANAGGDAGTLLDGRPRDIPVFDSIASMLEFQKPDYCVVGVATKGGVIPPNLRIQILDAVRAGVSVVNGLHQLLESDEDIVKAAAVSGCELIDVRKPRPVAELSFWTGRIFDVDVPRLAVLGTDCAVGKRTTAVLLRDELRRQGLRAEIVYTGQTGWLQGLQHGFILDSTVNDFVSGELERAIVTCAEETSPDVILIEGQSSFFNPSGPCGLELVISGAVQGVILQTAPGRAYYKGMEDLPGCLLVPVQRDIDLIRSTGRDVWALTICETGLDESEIVKAREELEMETGIRTCRPLSADIGLLAQDVRERLARG